MTEKQFNTETARLTKLIAREDAERKASGKSLAEKVAHSRECKRLREALRQHKLNYFDLVSA